MMKTILRKNKTGCRFYNPLQSVLINIIFGVILIPISLISWQTNKKMEPWNIVQRIIKSLPLSEKRVAFILDTELNQNSANEYFMFFSGSKITLSNGVQINNIDLRLPHNNYIHPGLLTVKLAGTCVSRFDVQQQYPHLILTEYPRGRSIDEVTSYTTTENWGELTFSFKENDKNCLSGISFSPIKK